MRIAKLMGMANDDVNGSGKVNGDGDGDGDGDGS